MTNFLNTDREIERYDEAELYAETATPDMIKGIRSSFNTDTGRTDLMAPLPSGGFVTLGSEAPDIMVEAPTMPGMGADAELPVEDDEFQLQSIRNFAVSGEVPVLDKDGKKVGSKNRLSRDDYLAAGYTDQQIDASGVMGETQQKTDRTEPLSVGEIETILREGGTLFSDYTPTMRENGSADLMETLMEISVDRRREELMAQGVDTAEISRIITSEQPEMRSLAENLTDVVFGNKNVLGTGVADFVTAGVMDMQEGYRMLDAGSSFNGGSATQRGLGILLIAAGVAEATGVGFALGKLIKASIPKIQGAMVSAGQNAELRMAERGPAVDFLANTMMSGVDPTIATDPLVAAAGRAVDDGFVAKVEPPTDDTPGIIAFHGSAADFDGFKLEKIGTGEGAQAYGYGLYFSDKEAIAEWYRNTLSSMGVDPQPLKDAGMTVTEEMMAASYIRTSNSAEDAARDWANWHGKPFNDDLIDTFKAAQVSDGKMYKVGIAVKPEDLLDYDKPFSEQTPTIQAALKKAGYKTERNMVVKEDGDNRFGVYEANDDGTETLLKHFTEPMLFKGPLEKQAQDFIVEQNAELLNNNGAQILDVLASGIAQKGLHLPGGKKKDAERLASNALVKAGIPGIKYLDNTSRDGAGTSSNYVIFDDRMVKILEKYGIVGPVAISAMALSEDET